MYPFLRMFKEMARASRMPPLGLFDTHVSHHLCWPWDLDPWVELNNGRTLTLYDLGRLPRLDGRLHLGVGDDLPEYAVDLLRQRWVHPGRADDAVPGHGLEALELRRHGRHAGQRRHRPR